MKTSRQQKGKRVEAPRIVREIQGSTGVKKSNKKTGGQRQQVAGRGRYSKAGDAEVSLSAITQVMGEAFPRSCDLFHEPKIVPEVGSQVGYHPSEKIKLQLFPIDECTKTGLERDGHNPFLELTLRRRKKISSVLKHLDSKWRSSSVAIGKPVLFPYNIRLEEISTCMKWTLDDDGTSASDVYAAIQSPKVFRLRYGWFPNLEPSTTVGSSVAAASFIGSEGLQKGQEVTHNRDKLSQVPGAAGKSISADVPSDCLVTLGSPSESFDETIDPTKKTPDCEANILDNEVKMGNAVIHSSAQGDNSLSNFSFSRLLNDASLFAKISNFDPESTGCRSNSQPIDLFSSDISMGGLFSEASLQGRFINHEVASDWSKFNLQTNMDKGLVQSSGLLDDNLTTMSIGGLLSEASLLGKMDKYDPKYSNNLEQRHDQLISDSLDAFIVSRLQLQPQPPKNASQVSCSSILDAEETCHAFPSRKLSSLGRADMPLKRSSALQGQTSDSISKSLEVSHFAEIKAAPGEFSEAPLHDSKTGTFLGFAGIRWT